MYLKTHSICEERREDISLIIQSFALRRQTFENIRLIESSSHKAHGKSFNSLIVKFTKTITKSLDEVIYKVDISDAMLGDEIKDHLIEVEI